MKLTKEMKEKIVRNVVKSTLAERTMILSNAQYALADDVYSYIVGPHKKAIAALPAGFMCERETIGVAMGNKGFRNYLNFREVRRVPSADRHAIAEDSALFKEWDRLNKLSDALSQDEKALKLTTRGLLAGVNTMKQLVDAWPGSVEFLDGINTASCLLPTVQAVDLKDLIDHLKG